jgi:hypothetical protein
MTKLGTKLLLTGRMGIIPETIRGRKQLQIMLDAVEADKKKELAA